MSIIPIRPTTPAEAPAGRAHCQRGAAAHGPEADISVAWHVN
ncbi:hypothetical protein [Hymenobacter sp. UYCo722]